MLVALGFLLATLISLLLAPVVWRRAARLATDRLKASLPISLTDFHAEKDQLRAEHAMQMRSLEVTLDEVRDKSARQMVDLGRQRVEIMTLTNQVRELRSALSERKSMTAVMEQTLSANVPRLKERLETEIRANIGLTEKVEELEGSLRRKDQQIEEASREVKQRDNDILKLRQEISANKRMSSVLRMPKFGRDAAPGLDGKDVGLAAVDGPLDEKGAALLARLQQENQRLGELMVQARAQLERANAFEQKELPQLRQEMRVLGAELLRAVAVPKLDAADAKKAPVTAAAVAVSDGQKPKRSLAERLKGVTKLKNELGA
jgi:chromosome segregation ATPase